MRSDFASLDAPWTMAFAYTRTVGPVVGTFLAALLQRRVLGLRARDGRVIVPPTGFDSQGGTTSTGFVEVCDVGTLTGFTWIDEPLATHPRAVPFAFALVRLDGADTAMLHVLDAEHVEDVRLGQRVRIVWAETTRGHITDIVGFRACDESSCHTRAKGAELSVPTPTDGFTSPIEVHYTVHAGRALSQFLRGLVDGRFIGKSCERCARVYVPPLGACSVCALPVEQDVELSHEGVVTTSCLVNLAVRGQEHLERPFSCANVLLDGADTPFLVRIGEMSARDVRPGMRVRARFRAAALRTPSLDAVECFVPTGEPDVDLAAVERARREVHRA